MSKLTDHIADITTTDYNTHMHTSTDLANKITATTTGGYPINTRFIGNAATAAAGSIPLLVVDNTKFGRVYIDYINYTNYSDTCACGVGCY